MGNVLVPAVYMVTFAISLFRRPNVENPTLTNIRILQEAQRARRDAERAARTAQAFLEQIQQQADRDREQARLRQEAADRAAARASEEAAQLRVQMAEAANAARNAQGLTTAAARATREEAGTLAREAQKERERARKMREEAEGSMEAAKEEAERAQRAADEERREAEAARAQAQEVVNTAEQEARKAKEAKEEAERRLKEGIQPVVVPSPTEVAAAKQRIQYSEDCFHFAVAGVSGSGKSSLVNAFRGLRSQDPGAAAVGVTETTLEMSRYPDPNPDHPFVWYDIPGAGTIKCRDWQYFNDQGLYVFDCIIVLFDNRFTMTDVAILTNARRFQIPTYIVRSKADQHIRNIMKETGYDSEGDDEERRNRLYKAARKQFIEQTRRSVQTNLKDADLPDQRVYIVSNTTMRTVVLDKSPKRVVDEMELVNDLLHQAYSRRVSTKSDEVLVSTRMNHGPTS